MLLPSLTLMLAACSAERPAPADLPDHTLAMAGDLMLGRRINEALFDDGSRGAALAEVRSLLAGADVAVVNGEGVASGGGELTDKGEPRPYTYRAHPLSIDMMAEAGIDVVTVGNNHALDYGADALQEMMDRLLVAGMDYTGGGTTLRDARQPAYRLVDDTVVAIVGADLSMGIRFRVHPEQPTLLRYPGLRDDSVGEIVDAMTAILTEARKHAHVVVFTPHWGDNWLTEPTAATRTIARRLVAAGYDAILGHSSHLLQGVELIDGIPVVYDAGNLLLDFGGGQPANRAILYEVAFDRSGVRELRAHPIWLETNRTVLAHGTKADRVLSEWRERSEALGTTVAVDGEVGVVVCDPGGMRGPETTSPPPARTPPPAVRAAPADLVLDALPASATPIDVRWENGIRLVGYQLLLDRLPVPKAGQVVRLYWTTDRPVTESLLVRIIATRDKERQVSDHIPGDWLLPTDRWQPGTIVRDETLYRLTWKPTGTATFWAGITDHRDISPVFSEREPLLDTLVRLGEATYDKDAPGLFTVLKRERAAQPR